VTGNNLPTVNPGANFTIPKLTPFTLTAIGADADAGDVLTYSWEEFDLAPSASGPNGTPPNTFDVDTDGVLRPLFRVFPPVTSPSRTYPSLTYILNNANTPPATFTGTSPTGAVCETAVTCVTGENLPSQTRTMNFRVVVRDNRAAGGGIVDAGRTVTVDAGSGPFVVTSPNTAVTVPGQFTVTWNVAGTTAAPVNAANVKISLSTDSGNTFPTLLYASTPNDGSQVVGTQGVLTTTARIKIEGVGNIFFDVSDTDFTITAPSAAPASVSGRITTPDGAPLAGVSLRLSGARTAKVITDADGDYRFESVDVDNFYSVTPTLVNYHFAPESQSFSLVGNKTDAVFTATRDAVSSGNAIDTADYFVRQHYLDFLGREPDESGFNFWSDQILSCGSDAGCRERRTINVSAAYFLSIEFQQTGGLVDGLYRASYGRAPRYVEFMPDTAVVARDVIVGRANWAQQLESNKRAFVDAWVERADFRAAYDGLTNKAFVDALIGHVGAGFNGDRDALLSGLNNGSLTRAAVLRQVVENEGFVRAKRNETFVMMEYFGYLRRDPDDSGYRFWLNKLNQFGGDFEQAEMVKAFITSGEYTQRFSQ
jgi:hypothetical protein